MSQKIDKLNTILFCNGIKSIEKINEINNNPIKIVSEVNDKYILKEFNCEYESHFYSEKNGYKRLPKDVIPKLFLTSDNIFDYDNYIILEEKLQGNTLYELWKYLSPNDRDKMLDKVVELIKKIELYSKKRINKSFVNDNYRVDLHNVLDGTVFFADEEEKIRNFVKLAEKYLDNKEYPYIHGDLHFSNIFVNNDELKIIDFEYSQYGPIDFEISNFNEMAFFNENVYGMFNCSIDYNYVYEYISDKYFKKSEMDHIKTTI
jgi:Predicted kinase